MKNNYDIKPQNEIEILSTELSPQEMYIIGFLKGFDRANLKQMGEKGILDFSVNVI